MNDKYVFSISVTQDAHDFGSLVCDNKECNTEEFDNFVIGKVLSGFKILDSNNTSDWQTYQNEKYGFEVKYPSNWNLRSERSIIDSVNKILMEVTIGDNDNRKFIISVDENDPQLYVYDSPEKQNLIINNTKVTAYIFPGGYECYDSVLESSGGDCSFFEIPVKHDNLWYRITAVGKAEIISTEYNQILSTFKFID